MTTVYCCEDECKWSRDGVCTKEAISMDIDLQCGDFESYRDSYTDSYWVVCLKDGFKFRRLIEEGKKVEYNGYVFYTEDRITDDGMHRLTEARTGVSAGRFCLLKDKWDLFLERVATYPDVSSYPIEERSNENAE